MYLPSRIILKYWNPSLFQATRGGPEDRDDVKKSVGDFQWGPETCHRNHADAWKYPTRYSWSQRQVLTYIDLIAFDLKGPCNSDWQYENFGKDPPCHYSLPSVASNPSGYRKFNQSTPCDGYILPVFALLHSFFISNVHLSNISFQNSMKALISTILFCN